MSDARKIALAVAAWVAVITAAHMATNVDWKVLLNERLPENERKLNEKLKRTSEHGCPGKNHCEPHLRRPAAEAHQGADHRDVPHHRRRVTHEEAAVTVENAEAPRREHEQSGTREKNLRELNSQLPLFTSESRRDQADQVW